MGFGKNGVINLSLILVALFITTNTHAQIKNIEVGMFVKIGACKSSAKHFEHIDFYNKSLVTDTVIKVDTLTGEGVFESFFVKDSEFEGKRLPCSYANKKFKVATLREFVVKGKNTRIMLLYTNKPNQLIWVNFDEAVEHNEISW